MRRLFRDLPYLIENYLYWRSRGASIRKAWDLAGRTL